MLGAQALRTKQKVEQKEKEKRLRERQKSVELQREKVQRIADEDARNAVLAYVAEHGGSEGLDSTNGDCNGTVGFIRKQQRNSVVYNPVSHADLNLISMRAMECMPKKKIQQRHSLNANSLSFVPAQQPSSRSARHSMAEKKRTSTANEAVERKKSEPAQPTHNRFLRWIGFSCAGKETEERKLSSTC